jgi:hypothetical protein
MSVRPQSACVQKVGFGISTNVIIVATNSGPRFELQPVHLQTVRYAEAEWKWNWLSPAGDAFVGAILPYEDRFGPFGLIIVLGHREGTVYADMWMTALRTKASAVFDEFTRLCQLIY